MSVIATAASVLWTLLFTPFLLFILCVIFLASIGKSLGVRRLYVNILLKLFEYGRQHIEVAKKLKRVESSEDEGGGWGDAQQQDGGLVIQRENLLAPDRSQDRPGHLSNGVAKPPLLASNSSSRLVSPAAGIDAKDAAKVDPVSGESAVDGVASGDETAITPLEESNPVTPTNLDFDLSSCFYYVKAGVESIIEDQVTSVFEAEELRSWNLLTRTNRRYEFVSWRLTVIWMMGFFVRYCFLLPLRILICFIGVFSMVIGSLILGNLPESRFKRRVNTSFYKYSFRILARSLSCVITFHMDEYKPKNEGCCVANHTSPIDVIMLSTENCFSLVLLLTACTAAVGCLPEGAGRRALNRRLSAACFSLLSRSLSAVITYKGQPPQRGICVANHTSPIDVLMLMCDNSYSLIGQRHGGFLGLLQRALARASPHIWFERSEVKDRNAVTNRLREHVGDPNNPPILIFPEGTCINNTSVMQFKKGSFEVGGTIYPVAIKYDPKFGDAFWNSSRYSMMQYLYMMMTSWAIVCDVWYLPPMQRRGNESAIEFANRVKAVIARQGGLVDLVWDGQLKRMKAKKEWKELQQEEFSRRLKGE